MIAASVGQLTTSETPVTQRSFEANQRISSAFPYLGGRIGHSMGDVPYKAPNISILYQSCHPFRNIIQKAHGVAEEIY